MKVKKETRNLWAEKTFDLTNIGAGVLIFSQIISEDKPNFLLVFVGFILVAFGYVLSYILLEKK
jgi:hypothetical protein